MVFDVLLYNSLVMLMVLVLICWSFPCPTTDGQLSYRPGMEYLVIDTGNATRPPRIFVKGNGSDHLVKTHSGCLSTHEFVHAPSTWKYQVARFKFLNTINIQDPVEIQGANALSLTAGGDIVVGAKGKIAVQPDGSSSSHQENRTRYVGGFVPNSDPHRPLLGGPGKGVYVNGAAGGAGHGGHGGGNTSNHGAIYGLSNVDQYLGGSTGAFTGDSPSGIGGPAIELVARGKIEISGHLDANALPSSQASVHNNEMIAGSSGGLIRLKAEKVNISRGATLSVKGTSEFCATAANPCKAGGGGGGIVQIVSSSGEISPNAIILAGAFTGTDQKLKPGDGYLLIKGVKSGHFGEFPAQQFSWGQNISSTSTCPSNYSTIMSTIKPSSLIKSSMSDSQVTSASNPSPTPTVSSTVTISSSSLSKSSMGSSKETSALNASPTPTVSSTGTISSRSLIIPSMGSSKERSAAFNGSPTQTVSSTGGWPTTYHRQSTLQISHKTVSKTSALTSTTSAPSTEVPTSPQTQDVTNLAQLHDVVTLFKEKESNVSDIPNTITKFLTSFEVLTVAGNLTTESINISVLLIRALNGLMLSQGLSANQSELQSQVSILLTTVDELLDNKDADTWRNSGMLMTLVEAVEETSSIALNFTSTTNQSFIFEKKNIEIFSFADDLNTTSNLTIPNPKKQDISTGTITFQPTGFSDCAGNVTCIDGISTLGRLVVSVVVFRNLTTHFSYNQQHKESEDSNHFGLSSEIVSVRAFYDGKPVTSLEKVAYMTFGNKTKTGSNPRCVYWKQYDNERKWSSDGLGLIKSNSKQTVCSTNHLTSFAVLVSLTDEEVSPTDKLALGIITYIGCAISLIALCAAIVIFLSLRSLNDIRYRIHLHLSVAMATAQVVFLAGITATEKRWICVSVAVLLHYFYTASFMWMSAEGLHLYFKVVTVFNLEGLKMAYYIAFCWGFPVIVVGISALTRIEGYGTKDTCWLSLEKGFIWSFVGPVIAIITFNLIMLGMTIKVVVSLKDVPESDKRNSVRSGVKAALVLLPLLGITWLFGLLSVNSSTIVFQYLFAIINSLQGLFIFSFHCIGNSEVRAALARLRKRHSMRITSLQEVSLDKWKSKSNGAKAAKETFDDVKAKSKPEDLADVVG